MIEVKREAIAGEQQNREWNAWKANQAQARSEGKLATDEDYERLRQQCREIMEKAKGGTDGKGRKAAQIQQPSEPSSQEVVTEHRPDTQGNQAQST